jgi:hypothetical protein
MHIPKQMPDDADVYETFNHSWTIATLLKNFQRFTEML